ncbi:hypothetical protein CDES_14480 (plasmid) [Corynebacterium deserti GIMN1.010]|uniref:Uncharacterized protein n=1 Tax=Corynebacterium deserti GIMN1.010 TaxID=931089 RepID=A0A0M4CLU8_9CORY|nr:hypothetical protein CDES_14480 [Corynebacterium deserti GIMN1.010]
MVAGVEGLLPGGHDAHGVDGDVGAETVGDLADFLRHLRVLTLTGELRGVDDVGGAELLGPLQLLRINVHRDDGGRTGDLRTGDRGHAHATEAENGDGLAALDLTGVDGRTQAGHDAATQQTGGSRISIRVDLGALALMDQGLLGKRTDTQGRGQLGAVGQGHLLRRVVGVETVLQVALAAGAALATHRPPVQDDEVADLDVGDGVTDGLNDTSRLVAQQEGKLIRDVAVTVRQIRVAHTRGLDLDDDIMGTRIRNDDLGLLDRCSLASCDDSGDSSAHDILLRLVNDVVWLRYRLAKPTLII